MALDPTIFEDYAGQQQKLARRQALVDSLLARSQQQDQPRFISNGAGTFYAGGNDIGSGISKALAGFAAQRGQKQLDQESTAFRGQYAAGRQQALQQYMEAAKTDPRGAALQAASSSFPELQAIGQQAIKTIDAGQIQPKDLVAQSDPNEIKNLATNGVGAFVPKPEVTVPTLLPYANPLVIPDMLKSGVGAFYPKNDIGESNGVLYDKNSGQVIQLSGAKPTTQTINGDLYEQSPSTGGLKKLDNAPKITVGGANVSVNAGQKEGLKKYFENAAKQVDTLGTQADSSQKLLTTIGQLRELHNAGINSNVTSGMATAAQNLAQSLGVKGVDAAKLGRTETYNSLITDLWQRAVSQYGGNRGVTQSEAEEIKKLTPLASSSPQARERLFAIMEAASRKQIQAYKEANASFAKAAAADDPNLFIIPDYIETSYTPTATAPGQPGAPMSLDDYLKKQRGGQ